MLTASAYLETANGSKYLQQLCKHFAHKVPVEYDATSAKAAMPAGPATMQADENGLHMVVTAEDDATMKRAKFVFEDHLKKFAFREPFDSLDWTDGTAGEAAA
ncbi:DUF2218 domain-containing protein [Pseudooceanicola algae]|uniref:2,4-dihydroxyhept-2-ene-1,7-dioic acid aldolase n=1 Tax=Pseudooceanicola algae TaxID=1537215 RepID=A0A418SGV0_9RHOB|nr:DUF2218 domain-containing protein [Pseudooceanicola algae]QPM88839.1 hypothetical protein PSAL_000410 [Pseudooceanicola algae]